MGRVLWRNVTFQTGERREERGEGEIEVKYIKILHKLEAKLEIIGKLGRKLLHSSIYSEYPF